MNIGLDFDGVVINSGKLKQRVAKSRFNVHLPIELALGSKIPENLLSEEQYLELQQHAYTDIALVSQYEEMPGAKDAIHELVRLGHRVAIVTARSDENSALPAARKWLQINDISVPIIGVGIGVSKRETAKQENLNVFVDDKVSVLSKLVGAVPHLFLFSQPYNHDEHDPNVSRADSWDDLYTSISSLG